MLWEKYGILGKQNKIDTYNYFFKSLLDKLNNLFVFDNLPPKVDNEFLNSNLFLLGYSAFFDYNGEITTNFGGIGGKPNQDYYCTEYILSNPVLGSKTYKINTPDANCILMYNTKADKQYINFYGGGGLYRLIKNTATLLSDNLLSLNMAQINTRVQNVVTASDDRQARSAEQILKRMYDGNPYQILTSDEFSEIKSINLDSDSDKTISKLLEIHQHILSDFYNQIGIPTTPYIKKERLVSGEIDTLNTLNNCNLMSMLQTRIEGCNDINNMFGTNISVELNDKIFNLGTSDKGTSDKDTSDKDTSDKGTSDKDTSDKKGGRMINGNLYIN